MTSDYWELLTNEEDIIRSLSVWVMSHTDLVDLVEIKDHWLQLRVIPDEIIPRFLDYQGFLESWSQSHRSKTKVNGYWGLSMYSLEFRPPMIEVIFENLSPVTIDLDTHQLSVWVTDGGTGKRTLVQGLSPINYSRMMSTPESFPKFVRIGYEYEKGIYNYT
jgi:hypothetical protein